MSETAARLRPMLDALPPDDRAELAYHLLRSLEPEWDSEIEAAWDEVLARRGSEIKSGQAVWHPAEDVLARLREKYS